MKSLVIVDDAAAVNDLFARVLNQELAVDVLPLASISQLETAVESGQTFDVAVVDLSFPEERRTGLDALLLVHLSSPSTVLAIITQGDMYVADLLRDAWTMLPIATVISKSAPIAFQVEQVRQLVTSGTAPVDPSILPLLPAEPSGQRGLDRFRRLVLHLGHAKLWEALFVTSGDVTYQQIVDLTSLRLNTVKNYRAQLLPELANHGLADPSLRQMHEFATRCRPVLQRFVDDVREKSRSRVEQ